jgi:hypothetical protein
MGFNRVFPPGTPIDDVLPIIKKDLDELRWKYIWWLTSGQLIQNWQQ